MLENHKAIRAVQRFTGTPISAPPTPAGSEVGAAIRQCGAAFLGIGVFSGVINLLALTGSLYMLQVYDRVLPSRSIPTLVALTVLMLILYSANGFLDLIRMRIMSRVGTQIDRTLRQRVFTAVLNSPLRTKQGNDGSQSIRDLDSIRTFLSGLGPIALFDLPWLPLYLILVYALHPWLGIVATIGAAILVTMTFLTEVRTRKPMRVAAASSTSRQIFSEANRRNAEVIRAMGMGGRMNAMWNILCESTLKDQLQASDIGTSYGTVSKIIRMILQSAILGIGAYLVILGEASGGVIIASSITVSRALAPIEIAIANWKGFLGARQAYDRLTRLLTTNPADTQLFELPPPVRSLSVENLTLGAPGQRQPLVSNVTFQLEAGSGLGIIGPSASGKSSLARGLVGVWRPLGGTVRLDGATLEQWDSELLGRHVGYLPQDIELFDGTVAENIARFDPDADMDSIITAARAAAVHDMILRFPDGYNTRLGESGACLSAGQRQRVALARALYGNPFLVVLDEPNSNLDSVGDIGLTQAILSVRARGGIVIVIAHRPSAIEGVDQLLVMNEGRPYAFGPKDRISKKIVRSNPPPVPRVDKDPNGVAPRQLGAGHFTNSGPRSLASSIANSTQSPRPV
jgi:PrtD family type I secretion system ABC transporter